MFLIVKHWFDLRRVDISIFSFTVSQLCSFWSFSIFVFASLHCFINRLWMKNLFTYIFLFLHFFYYVYTALAAPLLRCNIQIILSRQRGMCKKVKRITTCIVPKALWHKKLFYANERRKARRDSLKVVPLWHGVIVSSPIYRFKYLRGCFIILFHLC